MIRDQATDSTKNYASKRAVRDFFVTSVVHFEREGLDKYV